MSVEYCDTAAATAGTAATGERERGGPMSYRAKSLKITIQCMEVQGVHVHVHESRACLAGGSHRGYSLRVG